ncbi:MAG: L,D-transpeptidase/peptidoglycan binding protein [Actinomycetota bacterium]|nr:L,D-transpeptidase/peptidoglycan binding protein [Actinomycetota bacterium]
MFKRNLTVKRKAYILGTLTLVLFLGVAVAAYAWDASRSDEIAEGIEIGGIDVGGLTEPEAEALVTSELIEPLDRDLVATYDDVKYKLSAKRLAVRADVEGMVDSAFDTSLEGGLPTRIWRYATGGEIDRSIEPEVLYAEKEVTDLVARIAEAINRDPVNASVVPTPASLDPVAEQDGRRLKEEDLLRKLTAAVQSPTHRRVTAAVEVVEPDVTVDELAAQYPVYLTVDRSSFQLKLWEGLELTKAYTVAIGAVGFETPAGEYAIQNKAVDPAWSVPDRDWAGDLAGTVVPGGTADNPLKARWLGIYDGAGIHGTDDTGSLGSAASHGCVRMSVSDVVELYDQVPVGTPIYIG